MHTLRTADKDFETQFTSFLALKRDADAGVDGVVAGIIADVKKRGDAALVEYTNRFDRVQYAANDIRIPANDIASANPGKEVLEALEIAARRIRAYHEKQLPEPLLYTDGDGITLGWKWTPVDAAGIYVPGGTASYPSSVLMNAIPAKVAGVKRLVMVVPTPDGEMNPAVLAAARIAGVTEIYRVGGAQAVAALAYGTATIAPVAVIVGPGNAYVASAKKQVFGQVGIDMVAGPSEILVIADNQNNPAWIAADLLSQAEHDTAAQSILITDDAGFAAKVETEIASALKTLPRAKIASKSLDDFGGVIIVRNWEEAAALSDRIAPEHLELAVENPAALAGKISHAGAIFLGRHAPEALGDYIAGPSHVLPTSGTARFSSGLGVLNFMKRTSLIGADAEAARALGTHAAALADAEGLGAHALSLRARVMSNG
ncbi:MAG: histidinol dehydrogenase [Alphaproteobacteria bacterium]|nr:histidinol dehydrogenase [Alphaproteobacteria bacterium]